MGDLKSLKVLVVDDEPLARHWIRMQLGKCHFDIEVAEAASVALATQWLTKNTCDVILLDIHMPETNGLAFAQECQKNAAINAPNRPAPAIIFVSADSSHALQAFELAALDYLTKPVSVERLEQALQRVIERMQPQPLAQDRSEQDVPFITVESHQHISRIPLSQILFFQADSKYIKIVTGDQSYLIEDSLNTLEKQFEGLVVRVHRSYLVVAHAIEKLVREIDNDTPQDTWFIEIRGDNTRIPVSRRQLPLVKELLHKY